MVYPSSYVCGRCNESRFGVPMLPFRVCPQCHEIMRLEYVQSGTILGMPLMSGGDTDKLLEFRVVTNGSGEAARIHMARERNIIDAPHSPIRAFCKNTLKRPARIREFVAISEIAVYHTHRRESPKWCAACERELRKHMGGIRCHSFAVRMMGGHPIILALEQPNESE